MMENIILYRQPPHTLPCQLRHPAWINLGSSTVKRSMPLAMRERIAKLDERNELLLNKSFHCSISGLRGKRESVRNLANRNIMATREGFPDNPKPFICHSGSAVDPTTLVRTEA